MSELSRGEVLSKYIDHYRLTFEKKEDLDKKYEDLIDYKYEDDSKLWKKILFPLDMIEDIEYWNYCEIMGNPEYTRIECHPFIFKIGLIPKYCYVNVIPEINFCAFSPITKMWSNGDLPEEYMTPPSYDKVRLEPAMLILRETNQTTFMRIKPETTIKKVGNMIVKKITHKHVIDFYKIFEYINYEFRSSKFELTEYGFSRLCTSGEIDLSDKEYISRIDRR